MRHWTVGFRAGSAALVLGLGLGGCGDGDADMTAPGPFLSEDGGGPSAESSGGATAPVGSGSGMSDAQTAGDPGSEGGLGPTGGASGEPPPGRDGAGLPDAGDGLSADAGGGDAGADAVGMERCTKPEPPADVSAWVQESWDAQLGNNIRTREAWLLDNVMMGDGQINLCVRWGATSPPSPEVKATLASSFESWFNDWFRALGDHDCFPYGDGITTKLTGWAVRPGNESWVSDLGPEVGIYTETDASGEPICPSACSFFEHWDHTFVDCPGGEAFHTDYWVWVDDVLPGGGGAAAVGGDWGLRMPVSTLTARLGQRGDSIIEHEIGHGFGFQDYYDWTGSRPAGGSLMIVQSQFGGVPTVGDTWLLRRAWSETRALRGY